MSRIEAKGLTVRRGGRAILDRVDLDLAGPCFAAVIGANGAGKSTLLAALAGLIAPDAGEGRLDGQPVMAWRPQALARTRAYVPQTPRCDWPISVERLVALGLTPHLPAFGGLPAGMSARVDAMLEACDLADRRDQAATTLSGGELGRAMLARALVGEPEVLIVDEPVAGLDPRHALDAMSRLKTSAQAGRLVVASVHDLTLAARYADTLIALKAGRVVAMGPTAQVLTSELARQVFEVEARITATPEGPLIDLVG